MDGKRITWICVALTIVGPQKWLFWRPGPLLYYTCSFTFWLEGPCWFLGKVTFFTDGTMGFHHHQISISLHFQNTKLEEVFGPQKPYQNTKPQDNMLQELFPSMTRQRVWDLRLVSNQIHDEVVENYSLGGGFKHFYFHPSLWGNDPNWLAQIFQGGSTTTQWPLAFWRGNFYRT